jgi:uncharacterized protein (TIGR02646 family)
MRRIQKKAEPASLTQHRCGAHNSYDNYDNKNELRSSLVAEQRGLCCYCLQRIRADSEGMKIEHWQSQDMYPERQMEYSNLLGACRGGEGQKRDKQHCDTSKGNLELSFNPADPLHDVETKVNFLGDGTVKSNDGQFNREINEILNLNQSNLVRNRRSALQAFQQTLTQKNSSRASLQKELCKWNGDNGGELEPYCQVVVYYLRKKISKTP